MQKMMKTENTSCNKLSRCERETIYIIADDEEKWTCCTNIPKDMRKLEKQGWKEIDRVLYPDGTPLSVTYQAPRKSLSVGKAEKTKRIYTEDEKRIMSERAKLMRIKK